MHTLAGDFCANSPRKYAMSRAFAEGAVDGRVPEGVFFNEKQCLQRDLTVLALRAFAAAGGASGGASGVASGGLTILDAMEPWSKG